MSKNANLDISILKSIIFHLSVLSIGIASKMALFPDAAISGKQGVLKIKSVVRVDIVAMPKLTVKELKILEKAPINRRSAEETIEDKSLKLSVDDQELKFLKKKEQKNFLDLINNFSKKKMAHKKIRKKQVKKKKVKKDLWSNISSKRMRELINEGNKISEGTKLVGKNLDSSSPSKDGNGELNEKFLNYYSTIRDEVARYWRLPTYLLNKGLKCRVQLFISPDGEIKKVKIVESSGNSAYDARAQDSVRQAGPFAPPPSKMVAKRVFFGDLVLAFPLL